MNVKTVEKWKKRDSTQPKKRIRASRVLTLQATAAITDLCKDKWGASIRKISKELSNPSDSDALHVKISKSTISRYLRTTPWGRTAYTCKIKPMLTTKNIADRLRFCRHVTSQFVSNTATPSAVTIEQLIFTDESIVELFPRPNRQNTRIRTSDPELREPISIPKHGLKILVAGGMCYNGLTELHVVDAGTTIDGNYYRNRILPMYFAAKIRQSTDPRIDKRTLFADPERAIFMQDGAPAHTALRSLNMLSINFNAVWSKGLWPGNSPDLNPIENLWSILKDSIFIAPRPRTRDELITRVKAAWSSISLDLVQCLIASFPHRIEACLANNEGVTKY